MYGAGQKVYNGQTFYISVETNTGNCVVVAATDPALGWAGDTTLDVENQVIYEEFLDSKSSQFCTFGYSIVSGQQTTKICSNLWTFAAIEYSPKYVNHQNWN